MPKLSRWMIRTALGYLIVGLGLALVRAGQQAELLPGAPQTWWLPQLHLLTVGWLTQLIFGVAYWLFPKATGPGRTWTPRAVWAAYGLLNVGLLLRVLFEPASIGDSLRSVGLIASASVQWVAALLLTGAFWHRVRPK